MTKGIDEIPGEHDIKGWYNIMFVKNKYGPIAILQLLALIGFCLYTNWHPFKNDAWMIMIILILSLTVNVCLGLVKYWNELKGKI